MAIVHNVCVHMFYMLYRKYIYTFSCAVGGIVCACTMLLVLYVYVLLHMHMLHGIYVCYICYVAIMCACAM